MAKVDNILFIVEGTKDEPFIMENLKKHFLKNNEGVSSKNIIVSYGTVIYSLYKKFLDEHGNLDFDIDTFPVLKKLDDSQLKDIKRKNIDQIYLFFDYDGHASNAGNHKLIQMLKLFNNETDKGKLFVSYPMVESLLHIHDKCPFFETTAISENKYKKIARSNCSENLKHFNDYSQENWNLIIEQHCSKANYIVHRDFIFPTTIIEQESIFSNQIEKYDNENKEVAVLSAFPLMLLDYYGAKKLKEKILES